MTTILVVDDDQVFRELLTTIFELEGYQTVVASRPDEVVPTAREVKPALVLMDVHIARGDTLDVLRQIRQDNALNGVPVVMTSGLDRSGECLAIGADVFLLKPFRPSEVLKAIADLVDGQDMEHDKPDDRTT